MLNHVTLLGRLAHDPTIRYTQTGVAVANFDLCVQVPSKDKSAPPDFIPIVCWDRQADFVRNYLTKGRQIIVEGRITARKYTDNEGKTRKIVEVTAHKCYFADSHGTGQSDAAEPANVPATTNDPGYGGFTAVEADDLPF